MSIGYAKRHTFILWPLFDIDCVTSNCFLGKTPLKPTFSCYFTSRYSALKLSTFIYAPPFVIFPKITLHTLLSKDMKTKQATFFLKCQNPE